MFGYETAYDLKRYARMLSKISEKVQPVVVAGGGNVARHYISTARSFGSDEASLDILGIEVSRLNARLMILALGDQAYPAVPEDLEQVSKAV
ncbi:MAG: UMP kinase, partial [Nitrososphaera sp.]